MALERNGHVYLNTSEAISEDYLGVSYVKFKRIEKNYGLQSKQWVDQQRQKFFLKDALIVIKNTPVDRIEEARAKIEKMQQEAR